MKKTVIWLTIVLAGCATPPPEPVQAPTAAQQPESVSADMLRGGDWTVIAIDGVDTVVSPVPLLRWAGSEYVGGTGGCNNFVGRFTLAGDRMTLGPLASTRMLCMASPQGQEDKFFKAVEKTRKTRMAGRELLLADETDRVLLRLYRP
jgi:putative lipoprotein